jgi:hypothetical protein
VTASQSDLGVIAEPRAAAAESASAQQPPAGPHGLQRIARIPLLGFAPWVLFWVIGGPSTWETASLAALLAAVLLAAVSLDTGARVAGTPPRPGGPLSRLDLRRLKLLDVTSIVFFAGFAIAAVVVSRHDASQLDAYSQALSSGALGLIVLGSIVFGHPFTLDYAREVAPPEVWHTPLFKKINVVLSGVWAAVFLACGAFGVLANHAATKGARDWLNWYIPIILVIIAFRVNTWYPDRATAGLRDRAPDG